MSDRHFELPAHPNLEYYRKQAKHLQRTYATGDAAAQARVADVLGDRAAERFLLSDAQFVLAQEHGFRTWAEFRAHIQSRSTTEDRPVSRLAGMSPGSYASMADVGDRLGVGEHVQQLDPVRACFDADGRLRPDAAASRPNPADAGPFPPRIPATDDPQEIIAEAFVHACQHGRTEVVRWFLDLGVSPDVAPYFGRTGLHWAIPDRHLEVIRLLLERGADPSVRDEMLHADADAMLHVYFATRWHDPVTQQLHDLLESRSR
jgi:ankyrin repeat protein